MVQVAGSVVLFGTLNVFDVRFTVEDSDRVGVVVPVTVISFAVPVTEVTPLPLPPWATHTPLVQVYICPVDALIRGVYG